MTLLAVGSIALDSVETPHGAANEVLGGSATYFSYAASFFTPVRLVGVVGRDFPPEHRELLETRDIDLAGLEMVAQSCERNGLSAGTERRQIAHWQEVLGDV